MTKLRLCVSERYILSPVLEIKAPLISVLYKCEPDNKQLIASTEL